MKNKSARNACRIATVGLGPDAGGWLPRPVGAPLLRPWLQEADSLTACILAHAPAGAAFSVGVIGQSLARPLADEAALIATPHHERALARDVVLQLDGRAVVYAHTVAHRNHIRQPWHWLGRIGSRPLGSVLFSHPGVSPGPHYFRLLDRRHPLYRRAALHCKGFVPDQLAARRAVFMLRGRPLLVTEIFLPPLLELCSR